MSLASLPPYEEDARDFGAADRTPPQDVPAEQSVLGAMLLSKDAIADVVEVRRGAATSTGPTHEQIYDAILDLYGRGEPADAITGRRRAGQARRARQGRRRTSTCTTCCQSVSIAANAGYYAEIVREKAILRRLVEASIKISQMGYAGERRGRRHRRPGAAGRSTRSPRARPPRTTSR